MVRVVDFVDEGDGGPATWSTTTGFGHEIGP